MDAIALQLKLLNLALALALTAGVVGRWIVLHALMVLKPF